ncbi:thiol reductant ABC exporter subunit CydC [Cellulomonas composti]|uniref:Thiol reductant ABC exporter subunit CydC n=1 Tax=Cellulomonas composti TaxID=266130 RepID=A0A511JAU6_9CELL|nr:thiol reductant ABC exporter subunit CydC [Cellulomonas composti]GEL95094.1 thiol reductant ABC exporter subunit CydC [Cellulomonas composti]
MTTSEIRADRGTVRRAFRLLEVDGRRFAAAVTLGVLALGCAVALAAVSAWLIARASQMPPVLTLSIATVAVRAFGIGRGVLRYVERLVSHDLALRGMTTLRTTLYERLAAGRADGLLAVRRGDLLARVGADVDAVGDLVVRALLPAAVAGVLGVVTAGAMTLIFPPAGLALAACLVLAGVVAPWLAARAAARTETAAADARAAAGAAALGLLDDAGPLAVAGRVPDELASLRDADTRTARAVDSGAGPAALATGLGQLAVGLAVLAALVTGVPAVGAGTLDPVLLAVVVLTPLAAFEATALLPAAAIQLHRSRAAAARVLALVEQTDPAADGAAPAADPGTRLVPVPATARSSDVRTDTATTAGPVPALRARGLAAGWPGREPVVAGIDLDLTPGRAIAVVGPSGVGKTTLLLTLAGLLPRAAGTLDLTVPGADPAEVRDPATDPQRADRLVVVTEDAHVFGTTVLENLRVARGDVTPDEASAALRSVGLDGWLASLPAGLDTPLGTDARTVSGGERRRLLVARALLHPAPLLLLDEPTEHLDDAAAARVLAALRADPARGVLVVTHREADLDLFDEVVRLDPRGQDAPEGGDGYRAVVTPGTHP